MLRSRFLAGACLVAVVIACYLPALRAGFVWDDDMLVTENALVKGGGGGWAGSLGHIWWSAAAADYTPLTTTAFWVQWRLWSDNPAGYHLVAVCLQAVSAVLLWRVLMGLGVRGAWVGALLFAVHPVNVASVAWVAELKNGLSLPLYLGAVGCYVHYLDERRKGWLAPAMLAGAGAMLSKGSTVVLPMVLVLCALWKRRRAGWEMGVFFGMAVVVGLVTVRFQVRMVEAAERSVGWMERLGRAGEAIWFYLGKDLWPEGLCAVYPKWHVGNGLPALLAVPLLGLGLWLGRRWWGRGPVFAWGYFVVALLPVLGLLEMSYLAQAYVADWWQELALPGVTALAGAAAMGLWERAGRLRPTVAGLVAAITIALGAETWNEASGYETMERLCRRTLERNPGAWSAHNNLGAVLSGEGRWGEAAGEYEAALRLRPEDAEAHSNLGVALSRLGRRGEAIAQYDEAVRLEPDDAKAWFNLGNALWVEGQKEEAVEAYGKAVDVNGRWAAPRYQLGTLLLEMGRAAEAGRQAEVLVAVEPGSISGHYLLARAAAAVGRYEVGAAEAGKALELAREAGDGKRVEEMEAAVEACRAGRAPAAPEQ